MNGDVGDATRHERRADVAELQAFEGLAGKAGFILIRGEGLWGDERHD